MLRVSNPSVVIAALDVTLAWAIRVYRPNDTFTALISCFFIITIAVFRVGNMVVTVHMAASEV